MNKREMAKFCQLQNMTLPIPHNSHDERVLGWDLLVIIFDPLVNKKSKKNLWFIWNFMKVENHVEYVLWKNIKSISVDLFIYKKFKRRSCRPTSEISSKSYNAWSQKKIMECLGRWKWQTYSEGLQIKHFEVYHKRKKEY